MLALKPFAAFVLAAMLGVMVSGCQPGDPDKPRVASVESIAIAPNSMNMKVGAMQTVRVIATLSDGSTFDVTFESTFASNAAGVATVNPTGLVMAHDAGSATVTATHTSSGKTATVNVTVADPIVTAITAAPASVSLAPGGTRQISVTGTFDDDTTGDVTAASTFESSDTDVATVNDAGLVTAVAGGDATITVTHDASGETATVAVNVTDTPAVFTTIDFETPGVEYLLTGFGGAEDAAVLVDPTDATNTAARVIKSDTAELWAGTTVSTGPNTSVDPIPFTATATNMTVRVYSPRAGIPVRLKVEDAGDVTRSVETEATTTVADGWQTLTFDFGNEAPGTAALNPTYTYNKISIFFDFGKTGAAGGGGTFWFDDVTFVGEGTVNVFTTVTFDSAGTTYTLAGFGGAEDATVVAEPGNASNNVARVVKSATAELWAGTTFSTEPNNSVLEIPFTATATQISVRVYSPRAGIPVRLKVEDAADPGRSVETEATTTVAGGWQTLTFDFADEVPGTAALNLAYRYNRISIFFDFGTTGAAGGGGEFWFDDVTFTGTTGGGGGGGGGGTFTPINFNTPGTTYTLTGFGGAEDANVVAEEGNAANNVARVVKSATAELWAGTTVSTGPDFSVDVIPFTATATTMTVRVYSPRAGIPVRLKVETALDPTRSVETEATTTVANGWQTLTFNFANQAPGTAALNLAFTYNKVSIFFDFGKTGGEGGGGTFYFDDVTFE
jgi:hypothetical protein